MVDLSVKLSGIKLRNPLVLASGIMGVSASSMKFVEENGAGAVTMKSIGPVDRTGHRNPTVYSWGEGITNAVGLSNPGAEEGAEHLAEMKYKIYATYKTHKFLQSHNIQAILVHKISQPHKQPNLRDLLEANRFDLIINIPTLHEKDTTEKELTDGQMIRQLAVKNNVKLITTPEVVKEFVEKHRSYKVKL